MVERLVANEKVAGSNPVSRSRIKLSFFWLAVSAARTLAYIGDWFVLALRRNFSGKN